MTDLDKLLKQHFDAEEKPSLDAQIDQWLAEDLTAEYDHIVAQQEAAAGSRPVRKRLARWLSAAAAIVLLIGTRKQAENFAYRLELNGNRRRLTWEATPRSIHDGVSAAIMNSDCLVFDTAIAHLFADNGNLGINVTISTCCP